MSVTARTIYLAAALDSQERRAENARVAEHLRRDGHIVYVPQEAELLNEKLHALNMEQLGRDDHINELRKIKLAIFEKDYAALLRSDVVVCVLHTLDDVGVAYELAVAHVMQRSIYVISPHGDDHQTTIESMNPMLAEEMVSHRYYSGEKGMDLMLKRIRGQ